MTPLEALCADRGWTIEPTRDRIYVALLERAVSLVEGEPAMFVGCSIRAGVVRPHIETTTDEDCAEAVAAWPALQAMARELREAVRS